MARYSAASGINGALQGGTAGFTAGGPIGGAIGATIGGLTGLFGSRQKKKKPKRLSAFDRMQQELYNDQYASLRGDGIYSDLFNFDPDQYNQMFDQTTAMPAYRSFQENVIPKITSQFRGGGIYNSSYTGDALARAGRDVQESLDALRAKGVYEGSQDALRRKYDTIDRMLNRQTFAYEKPSQMQGVGIDAILNKAAPVAGDFLRDLFKKEGNSMLPSLENDFRSGAAYLPNYRL